MTRPAELLKTWDGHPGDGEIAYVIAVAASTAEIAQAREESRDVLIGMTGDLRAGPVHWVFLARENALEVLDTLGMKYEPAAAEFLLDHPGSLVVLALAKTDAPWRWTA